MVVTRIHRGVEFARYPIDTGQYLRKEILHEFAVPYKLDPQPQAFGTSSSTKRLAVPSTPPTRRATLKEEWQTPLLPVTLPPIQTKGEVATPRLWKETPAPLLRSARRRGGSPFQPPHPFVLSTRPSAPNPTRKSRSAARACKRRLTSYWTTPSIRRRRKTGSIEHLSQRGFKRLRWDRRRDFAMADDDNRIFAVLLARDRDSQWADDIAEAAHVLSSIPADGQNSLTAGIVRNCTHKLGRASQPHTFKVVLDEVMNSDPIKRIAKFQSDQFSLYAPKAYARCHTLMRGAKSRSPPIPRNFETSVYPSIRFTMGPDASGFTDIDHDHASGMFTAFTALGSFEHTSSGILVFPAIKRYVEFPPGTTALLLSSTFRYGTTSVHPTERRMCIAQYCTTSVLQTGGSDTRTRWTDAIELLSKYPDLLPDRELHWVN